jgi:hypothetical protein
VRACRAVALSICACCSVCSPARPAAAAPADVTAEPPDDVAVTVYRSPVRDRGSIDVNHLGGFALISETRRIRLPAGSSRLRFDGVADGIEAQSAIITGLPAGVIEKNRDAKVLSPSALLSATLGKPVELLRTDRKTGRTDRAAGTILSDAAGGVVFSTADGIEALRCSGMPETFSFEPAGLPAARPSLSVLMRTPAALAVDVTLSYLSRGFDWAADYSATLSADGRSMDLGAWVTLANSNGTEFASARTQVVAGRVNREHDAVAPVDLGAPILARCWPRGSTSDSAPRLLRFVAEPMSRSMPTAMMMAAPALAQVTVTQHKVVEEQLGDLKLYRVPQRTTVASRQSKQVRLLDRAAIPVVILYRAELSADAAQTAFAAERVLRTVNDKSSHLGVPLPSGSVAVFALQDADRLLLHESSIRDLAVNEVVEIGLGPSPDVQVAVVHEKVSGATLRAAAREQVERVQISNARPDPVQMELRVALQDGARVIRADHPFKAKNSRPMFQVTVPARGSAVLVYQIRYSSQAAIR